MALEIDLDGRVAVVTGGASGIGREIARRFAAAGCDVVVADVRREPREGGRPVDEEISDDLGRRSTFVECDVTEPARLVAAVEAADEWGGVDIMVNNAGIFRSQPFLEVEEKDYQTLMDINVKGVFFGAQAAARRMVDKGAGCIVNMSSVAGLQGMAPYSTYCTSKGAVRLLTYTLAQELGPHGIRVNAVHPGLITTTMTTEDVPLAHGESEEAFREQIPLDRLGLPGDIADVTLFLASDLGAYVTGASLVADGGLTRF